MEFIIFIISAFVAGFITFLLPCTYPIIPGYIVVLASNASPNEVMKRCLSFLLGFAVVAFLLSTALSVLIGSYRDTILFFGGLIIIFFGFVVLGSTSLPSFLSKNASLRVPKFFMTGINTTKSFVLGVFMSLGWTPCVGPILASILILTGAAETYFMGSILLAVFLLGLSFPFILVAYIYTRKSVMPKIPAKFFKITTIIGGIALITLGIIVSTNNIGIFEFYGYRLFESFSFLVEIEEFFVNLIE